MLAQRLCVVLAPYRVSNLLAAPGATPDKVLFQSSCLTKILTDTPDGRRIEGQAGQLVKRGNQSGGANGRSRPRYLP
jgi:hypothetical protein